MDPHLHRAGGDAGALRSFLDRESEHLGQMQSLKLIRREIGEGLAQFEAEPGIIFDTPVGQRYDKALSLLGIDAGMLSLDAGHA